MAGAKTEWRSSPLGALLQCEGERDNRDTRVIELWDLSLGEILYRVFFYSNQAIRAIWIPGVKTRNL